MSQYPPEYLETLKEELEENKAKIEEIEKELAGMGAQLDQQTPARIMVGTFQKILIEELGIHEVVIQAKYMELMRKSLEEIMPEVRKQNTLRKIHMPGINPNNLNLDSWSRRNG